MSSHSGDGYTSNLDNYFFFRRFIWLITDYSVYFHEYGFRETYVRCLRGELARDWFPMCTSVKWPFWFILKRLLKERTTSSCNWKEVVADFLVERLTLMTPFSPSPKAVPRPARNSSSPVSGKTQQHETFPSFDYRTNNSNEFSWLQVTSRLEHTAI